MRDEQRGQPDSVERIVMYKSLWIFLDCDEHLEGITIVYLDASAPSYFGTNTPLRGPLHIPAIQEALQFLLQLFDSRSLQQHCHALHRVALPLLFYVPV